jgi:DNA-binding transcriptional LysR family regulator
MLRRHNLNSLAILDALLRYRNVTRAGNELGLSQSATSHALKQLREQFGDPLLVRVGRHMMLTHRAQALVEPLSQALGIVDTLLETREFDPAKAVRSFKIGTADYIGSLILPALMRELSVEAPNVVVHVDWVDRDVGPRLRAGELDLAIVPHAPKAGELHGLRLFTDELVVVAARDNCAVHDGLTVEELEALPFASFGRAQAELPNFTERQLLENNVKPRRRLVVPDFMLLCSIVSQTNYVTVLHGRFAEAMSEAMPIKFVPIPFEAESAKIVAYWGHQVHQDPGHRWFRSLVVRCCQDIPGG